MRELNFQEWERREAYTYFSQFSNPFYMVSFRQDVTKLYQYAKTQGISFYHAFVWACTQAINQVEAFQVALLDGRLVRLEGRNPSFTELKRGTEQFYIVTMEHIPGIGDFCREAKRLSQAQETFLDSEKETEDLIYYSCLPWIELTGLTNERNLSAPGALDDSIPRIAWGKYVDENGRKKLGVSIEVNHRFIDGVHIGRFAKQLETCIDQL